MEITVFGAGGFVGMNLLSELADTDHTVRACDVQSPEYIPDNAEFFEVDITNKRRVDEVVAGTDAIAHLAAHQLPESLERPRRNAEVNIGGSLAILDAAREHDVGKVFFPSASSILGDVEQAKAPEDATPSPQSPYGVSKHAVEEYLEVYHQLYELEFLVFRFFNVYGPYQYPDSGAFVPVVLSRLARDEAVYVTGTGQQTRDFVYVGDVVDFIVEGLKGNVSNEIVNMGYGERMPLIDAIRIIADTVGVSPEIEYRPERDDEIANFCAATTKCEQLFGRTPETSFSDGVRKTYDWMRQTSFLEK